jgi:hypothetical protein
MDFQAFLGLANSTALSLGTWMGLEQGEVSVLHGCVKKS